MKLTDVEMHAMSLLEERLMEMRQAQHPRRNTMWAMGTVIDALLKRARSTHPEAEALRDLLRRLYLNIPIRNGIPEDICREVESVIQLEARR